MTASRNVSDAAPGGHAEASSNATREPVQRRGDRIAIPGDYQYRALTEGHPVQRYWHASKLKLVDRVLRPSARDRVLDVGCGSGVVADHIASTGATVIGLDPNAAAIEFARHRFVRPNLEFVTGFADDLSYPDGAFTKIAFMEVLEHVRGSETKSVMRTLRRLLSPGGRLLVTTPNYAGLWPALEAFLDRTGLAAHMAEDQHVSRYDRSALCGLVEAGGLRLMRVGTFCTVAPFVAAFHRGLADRFLELELRRSLPFGSVLYALAAAP